MTFFTVAVALFVASVALTQEPAPRAVLQETLYDFETVKQGTRVQHTIPLRNAGNADLIVERMSLSLPAVTVRVPRAIPPGREANLILEVNTAEVSGEVQGDVILHTNDPLAAHLRLHIKGRVRRLVEVLPRALFLSAFRWEVAEKQGALTLANHDESPLEILGVRSEGDRFTTRLASIEAGQRYRLAVNLLPSAPAGREQGRIIVDTNKGEVAIMVFTFIKEKVYANPPEVDLGRLSLEQLEKQPSLLDFRSETVFIYKHHGQDFRIRVESSLPFIGVEKTPPEGPGAVVNIPRQGPTGIFELRVIPIKDRLQPGKFQGTIRVFTNDEEFPELLIPVRVEVE